MIVDAWRRAPCSRLNWSRLGRGIPHPSECSACFPSTVGVCARPCIQILTAPRVCQQPWNGRSTPHSGTFGASLCSVKECQDETLCGSPKPASMKAESVSSDALEASEWDFRHRDLCRGRYSALLPLTFAYPLGRNFQTASGSFGSKRKFNRTLSIPSLMQDRKPDR